MTRQLGDDITLAVDALSDAVLRERVWSVVHHAADITDVRQQCHAALDLAALVDELDEAGWDANDAGHEDDYVVLFRRARAANAWLHAAHEFSRENAHEALYEALHALGGDEEARQALMTRLTP